MNRKWGLKIFSLKKIFLLSVIAIFLLILIKPLCPQSVDNEIVLKVAVHVSEYTKANGLSLNRTSDSTYPWHYFQVYTLLEEALISDGTPFIELSDLDIEGGALLTSKGNPRYPIIISLASECISDNEAAAIRTYINKGGFVYIGSSAWTRFPDGSFRPDFALNTEMGISSVNSAIQNWINIGDVGARIQRVANHRLVDHLVPDVFLHWAMPESYFDTYKFFADGSAPSHPAWSAFCTTATPLAIIEGINSPLIATKNYGNGWCIYHAELSPLAGWGEGNVVLLEYGFLRKAIEWAFEAQKLPLIRVAAWPYPFQAAFVLRHDDISSPPMSMVLEEEARGVSGQYFITTSWCDPSTIPGILESVKSHGAIIGSHSHDHVGPDLGGYEAALENIVSSLDILENWTGNRPDIWVSPYFGAILDESFTAIQNSGVIVSGGEQSIGPFPHYALSMIKEKIHYNFLQIPPTFWISENGSYLLSSNDGKWYYSDIQQAVDFVYALGGLISIYDHMRNFDAVLSYIDYANTKPRLWKTNNKTIALWWAKRNHAALIPQYFSEGSNHILHLNTIGSLDEQMSVDLLMPSEAPVSIYRDNNSYSDFIQNGRSIKLRVGSAQNIDIYWSSLSAIDDNYSIKCNNTLIVRAPGVLANDSYEMTDSTLVATLKSEVRHGNLRLNADGSFSYVPNEGYYGQDSFTYLITSGSNYSNVATVSITVSPPEATFGLDSGNNVWAEGANTLNAMRFENSAGTGQLTKLEVLFNTSASSGKVRFGVYADNNGSPGALLLDAGEVAVSGGWVALNGLNLSVTKGTYYWLVFILQNSNPVLYQSSQPSGSHCWAYRTYGALPAAFPGISGANNNRYVMRATVYTSNIPIPPVAANDSYSTHAAQVLTVPTPGVLANDSQGSGAILTATLVSNTSHGTVNLNSNGSFVYTPNPGYVGADSFTYLANNGLADSNIATVTITINNNPPVAVDDAYSVNMNGTLTVAKPGILSNDTDDGNILIAILGSTTLHGALVVNSDGSFTYTPDSGYIGLDSFSYQANDGIASSNVATVTISVKSIVNSSPVAKDDSFNVTRDLTLSIAKPGVLSNDSDAEGDLLTSVLVSTVNHGSLTLNSDGSFTYIPLAGYTGDDSFTYLANDGKSNSNAATVIITVSPPEATFGLDSGNNVWAEGANTLNAMRFENSAGTGQLTKLEVLFNTSASSGKVRFGVYADNNGSPGALLLDAGEVAVSGGWVALNGLNLSVTKGTYYWLVFILQNSNPVLYQSNQPSGSHCWAYRTYGALPATFPGISGANSNRYVMRATVKFTP